MHRRLSAFALFLHFRPRDVWELTAAEFVTLAAQVDHMVDAVRNGG